MSDIYSEIYDDPKRNIINRELSNLRLSCRSDIGKVEVVWLVYHNIPGDGRNAGQPLFSLRQDPKEKHKHMFYETHFCLRGSCAYDMEDGTRLNVEAGEVLYIPPDCRHKEFSKSEDLSKIAFAFSVASESVGTCPELQRALSGEPQVFRSTDGIRAAFREIMEEVSAHRPFYAESIETLALRIVLAYARQLMPSGERQAFAGTEIQVVDKRMQELIRFVEEHVTEDITVSDVADALHLSTKQINRLLQKELMMSCSEYIQRKKAERAKEMLSFTDMRVEDIAYALGYANVFSFIKFFKREEGMPPGLFRMSRYNKTR